MDNNENVFEYLTEDNIIPIEKTVSDEVKLTEEKANQFVNGLPDWDLEPPYEIVRRHQS